MRAKRTAPRIRRDKRGTVLIAYLVAAAIAGFSSVVDAGGVTGAGFVKAVESFAIWSVRTGI